MSMLSPTAVSRDHMELDRLAEELVTRESGRSRASLGDGEHDLPAYVPLTHDNPYLSVETFNVEDFLLSRSYTSLPDLRSELRDYLATLKEELVKLINDDYEAFISLSTDLRGEGARLERLKWPLGDLREQVLVRDSSFLVAHVSYDVAFNVGISCRIATHTGCNTTQTAEAD